MTTTIIRSPTLLQGLLVVAVWLLVGIPSTTTDAALAPKCDNVTVNKFLTGADAMTCNALTGHAIDIFMGPSLVQACDEASCRAVFDALAVAIKDECRWPNGYLLKHDIINRFAHACGAVRNKKMCDSGTIVDALQGADFHACASETTYNATMLIESAPRACDNRHCKAFFDGMDKRFSSECIVEDAFVMIRYDLVERYSVGCGYLETTTTSSKNATSALGSGSQEHSPLPTIAKIDDTSLVAPAPVVGGKDEPSTSSHAVFLIPGVSIIVAAVAALVLWHRRRRAAEKKLSRRSSSGEGAAGTPSTGYRSLNFEQDEIAKYQADAELAILRVPLEKVQVGPLLSRGAFGEVYAGKYQHKAVAIKRLHPDKRRDVRQITAFFQEIKLMASMDHERIVRLVGIAWDAISDLCVLIEFMSGGDLRSVLDAFETEEHRQHGFDTDKIRIALHVAHGLAYLHTLEFPVLHRDLKSKNILLDSKLNAKITDFGSHENEETAT